MSVGPEGSGDRTIDVHSHLLPQAALERIPAGLRSERTPSGDEYGIVADGIRALGRGVPLDLRDRDRHRARQEARGVDVSIVGPWMDAVSMPLDPRLQRAWCRVLNESYAAELDDDRHTRFVAAMPDLDGGACAAELEWAVAHGAVGCMLSANPELGTLARRDLFPLWETAERLGVPIILHPANVELESRMRQHQASILVGNPFETTMAALSLIAAGVPERYPALKVMLVHGGGYFPYQYGRIVAGFDRWPGMRERKALPLDYVRWFYYDTVLFEEPPLKYLLDVAGLDHVLAGSDCPFPMTDYEAYDRDTTLRLGLSDAESVALTSGNAVTLFGLRDLAAESDESDEAAALRIAN